MTFIDNKVAYINSQNSPSIPSPNNASQVPFPNISNGDIVFKNTAGILYMYEHIYRGGFTNIKGAEEFEPTQGSNTSGHTDCGSSMQLLYNGPTYSIGVDVGFTAGSISGSTGVAVSPTTISTISEQIGENHKRTYWKVYTRTLY